MSRDIGAIQRGGADIGAIEAPLAVSGAIAGATSLTLTPSAALVGLAGMDASPGGPRAPIIITPSLAHGYMSGQVVSQDQYPISTISISGWAVNGAATAHEALDDRYLLNGDDGLATYLSTGGFGSATFEVLLSDVPYTPIAPYDHVVYVVGSLGAGFGSSTLNISLVEGTTVIASSGAVVFANVMTLVLTPAEADAITNYADLRIRVVKAGNRATRTSAVELRTRRPAMMSMSGSGDPSGRAGMVGTVQIGGSQGARQWY